MIKRDTIKKVAILIFSAAAISTVVWGILSIVS